MPDGAGTSREREGSERALRCARGSRGENRALRANRKREDVKQALEHMSRRALERGRRSGLKEQKESWCGGCFAFLIGLKARERYPFLAKPPLVDKNRRYVSHFRAGRSRGPRRFRKRPGHSFSPSERVFSLE